MPRMGKTEGDWNGLKLGLLKTVRPNSFSTLIPAACNFKNNALDWDIFVCLRSLILSLTCNFFVYFKLHSDWGRVIGKIKQNELDSCDTAPLTNNFFATTVSFCDVWFCLQLSLLFATPRFNSLLGSHVMVLRNFLCWLCSNLASFPSSCCLLIPKYLKSVVQFKKPPSSPRWNDHSTIYNRYGVIL